MSAGQKTILLDETSDEALVDSILSRVSFVATDTPQTAEGLAGAPWFDAVERHARRTMPASRTFTLIDKGELAGIASADLTKDAKDLADRLLEKTSGWRIHIASAEDELRDIIATSSATFFDLNGIKVTAAFNNPHVMHLGATDRAHDLVVRLATPYMNDATLRHSNIEESMVTADMNEKPIMPEAEPGMTEKMRMVNDHEMGHAASAIIGTHAYRSDYDKYREEMRADGFMYVLSVLRTGSDEPARRYALDRTEALFFGGDTTHWSADIAHHFTAYGHTLRAAGHSPRSIDPKELMRACDAIVDTAAMTERDFKRFAAMAHNSRYAMITARMPGDGDAAKRFAFAAGHFIESRRERIAAASALNDDGLRTWVKNMMEADPSNKDVIMMTQGTATLELNVQRLASAAASLSTFGQSRAANQARRELGRVAEDTLLSADILQKQARSRSRTTRASEDARAAAYWRAGMIAVRDHMDAVREADDAALPKAARDAIGAIRCLSKDMPEGGGDIPLRLDILEKTFLAPIKDTRSTDHGPTINAAVPGLLRGAAAVATGLSWFAGRSPEPGGLKDLFMEAARDIEAAAQRDPTGQVALKLGHKAISETVDRIPRHPQSFLLRDQLHRARKLMQSITAHKTNEHKPPLGKNSEKNKAQK